MMLLLLDAFLKSESTGQFKFQISQNSRKKLKYRQNLGTTAKTKFSSIIAIIKSSNYQTNFNNFPYFRNFFQLKKTNNL